MPGGDVDPLKYQPSKPIDRPTASNSTELMTVKLRYKTPAGDTSRLIEVAVRGSEARISPNVGFAAAVAEFGMLLRRSDFRGSSSWKQAMTLATTHRGADADGYRAEFIRLVDLASALDLNRSDTSFQRPVPRPPAIR